MFSIIGHNEKVLAEVRAKSELQVQFLTKRS